MGVNVSNHSLISINVGEINFNSRNININDSTGTSTLGRIISAVGKIVLSNPAYLDYVYKLAQVGSFLLNNNSP